MVLDTGNIKLSFVLLLAMAVITGKSQADALPESLSDILQAAYNSNLDYQISLQQVEKAKQAENIAYARLYPSLSMTSARNEQLSNNQGQADNRSYQTRFTLSQTLYDPTVWNEWKRSELALLSAEFAYLRQKQQLTFQVKNVWFGLITNIELAKESKASLQRLEQHRKNAKHLYENGSIWRNDLLQADVRVARGEQSLLIAQNNVKRSLTELNVLLNRNILTEITPKIAEINTDFDVALDEVMAVAVSNRPDLKQQELAVQIAKRNKKSAFAGYLPKVTATVSKNKAADHFQFSDSRDNTQFNINMSWTLWDGLSTYNRNRSAYHDVQIALKNEAKTKDLVHKETHTAWLALQESKHNILVLEKSMQQAIENYRVTEIRYKEQLSTANDVLDAQDLLTSTRNSLLDAKGKFQIAKAQLNLATGNSQ